MEQCKRMPPVLPVPPRLRSLLAWLFPGLLLVGWAVPAHAASMPALHEMFLVFDRINDQITNSVGTALGTRQVETVVNVLFSALAIGLFVWKFAGFALRGFDMLDLLTLMMTIFFVYILLTSYKAIFPPILDGGRYVSEVLGRGIANRDGSVSLAEATFRMLLHFDFSAACGVTDCLGSGFLALPGVLVAYVMVLALGIIATLVELWTMWGFQIAYAVGWLTIPFLLFERLSFLFDGWLKFIFGMIVYVIVAKINLALVLLGLEVMFGVGDVADQTVQVHGFFDVIGLLVFMAVGIATLYSTGRFASAIVSSAGGGGIGEMVQKMASTAATVAGAAVALAL